MNIHINSLVGSRFVSLHNSNINVNISLFLTSDRQHWEDRPNAKHLPHFLSLQENDVSTKMGSLKKQMVTMDLITATKANIAGHLAVAATRNVALFYLNYYKTNVILRCSCLTGCSSGQLKNRYLNDCLFV